MELEKIVVSDSVKDLEEKLQNRERMQVEKCGYNGFEYTPNQC